MSDTLESSGINVSSLSKNLLRVVKFVFTFMHPALLIYLLIKGFSFLRPFTDEYPALIAVFIIDIVFTVSLVLLDVISGISFWKEKPRSLKKAKANLWLTFLYTIMKVFWPLLVTPPDNITPAMKGNLGYYILAIIIYIALMTFYFARSKIIELIYYRLQ